MFPEITHDDVFRLETERLWLRWPRAADAAAFARLAGDPEVSAQTSTIPHPYNIQDAEDFVLRARAENALGEGLVLALSFKRRPDEAIGVIGVHGSANRGVGRLGYWIGRKYWGQGLATEAGRGFVDLVFGISPLNEIVSDALPGNIASRRVLEKLGFTPVGQVAVESPARGGEVTLERARLTRGAAHTVFGARRPRFSST